MSANFFSNKDPQLPNLNLNDSPKIKKGLPRLHSLNKMQLQGDNILFDIEGKDYNLDDIAEKLGRIYG